MLATRTRSIARLQDPAPQDDAPRRCRTRSSPRIAGSRTSRPNRPSRRGSTGRDEPALMKYRKRREVHVSLEASPKAPTRTPSRFAIPDCPPNRSTSCWIPKRVRSWTTAFNPARRARTVFLLRDGRNSRTPRWPRSRFSAVWRSVAVAPRANQLATGSPLLQGPMTRKDRGESDGRQAGAGG